MNGLSSFTSIFEIFSLVYISATTIRQVLEEILKPILAYYQNEENVIKEKYDSYQESRIAQGQLQSFIYHIYSYILSKTPNLLAIQEPNVAQYVTIETSRLIKKYRPIFFYTSLFCFVCLILSGINENIYFNFLTRFLISSYLLILWHLSVTRSKNITQLNEIWICNNWIFNTIFLFIFSIISHIIFSLLSLTNIINIYNFFTNKIFGSAPVLFLFASSLIIIVLLLIFYVFYVSFIVPIKKPLKYAIIIIPIIEIIIRLPNIISTFGFKFEVYNLLNYRGFIFSLCVIFIFLPILFLFSEHFLPSIWNKIKLKFLTNLLNTIHQNNIDIIENTGITVSDTTIENIDKPTPLKTILTIILIFIISINFINYYFIYISKKSEVTKSVIEKIINQANKSEYTLYENIPNIDTSLLKKHFIINSPAYKQILKYAHNERENGRQLCKKSSTYCLNSIKIITDDSMIKVSTVETWNLEWFNPSKKDKIIKYDTTNTHTYWLEKENQTWKIKVDDYGGKSKEIFERSICN